MATKPKGTIIPVTESAISTAIKGNSSHCMIAESIKTTLPWAKFVSVDLQTIRFSDMERRQRLFYLTPRKAQLSIISFDQGGTVEPFELVLRQPHRVPMNVSAASEANRRGVQTQVGNKGKSSKPPSGNGSHNVVETVGKAWPTVKIGRRRQFGLRALER